MVPAVASAATPVRRVRRSEVIGALGTVVEWYDFSLYVYMAPVYARVFFGGDGGASHLISTFALFAIAYFARPLGAMFFGRLGDRKGRKRSLIASAVIMTVALVANGLLPGEDAIGLSAIVLLLAVRIAMGFAVGGEYSGILVFLVETAGDRNRGLVASWSPATAALGSLLAVGVSALVTGALDQQALDAWGWRLPLFLGAALAGGTLLLRRGLTETAAFDHLRADGALASSPLEEAVRTARRALFVAFALSAVGSVAYYLNVSFVPTFLAAYENVDPATALRWSTLATAAMLVTTPAFGLLADIVGRRWALILVGGAIALITAPLFGVLGATSAVVVIAGASALAITAGAWSAVAASAIPELFPARLRFSGIAISYNLAVAVFGGLTPLMATVLIETTGAALAPALACAAFGTAGVVVALRMSETARRPLRP